MTQRASPRLRLQSGHGGDADPHLPVTPGFFAGWATVAHTIDLTDNNHATSAGTNAFYKADGTLYRTGCSTSVAQRFE